MPIAEVARFVGRTTRGILDLVHAGDLFLRARLADRDDRDVMIEAARHLHPGRPGALDLPTWLVGRGWCHPGVPRCATCPLTQVCPKEIERAANVTSV